MAKSLTTMVIACLSLLASQNHKVVFRDAYFLNAAKVEDALQKGFDANQRLGQASRDLLRQPGKDGVPAFTKEWTLLHAVAASPTPSSPNTFSSTKTSAERTSADDKAEILQALETERQRRIVGELLLDAGADLDAMAGSWRTPLVTALVCWNEDFAIWLIEKGARLDVQYDGIIDGTSRQSLLHLAAHQPQVARLLLEKGADVHAKDSSGQTPIDRLRTYLTIENPPRRNPLKVEADLPGLLELMESIAAKTRPPE